MEREGIIPLHINRYISGVIKMKDYNLSLVFLPQDAGGYTVICPEINCFSDGETIDEAENNIREIIPYFLEKAIKDDGDTDLFSSGMTMPGKVFREITVKA